MANWPPTPNNDSNNSQNNNQNNHANNHGNHSNQPNNSDRAVSQPTGQEWKIIEKTMLASIEEQRKSRRWNIIFKVLTFAYLFFILIMFGRGCQQTPLKPGSSSDHIAIVDIKGVIKADSETNSGRINYALKEAFKSKTSKAIVLNINSPGGSPVQSDEIWQRIRKLRKEYKDKKVYAYIGDIGASGAYYIASAADEIWVNKSSLIGSIGVIMPNYELIGLTEKLGVKDRTMTSGEYKNILSMTKPINEFEKQHVQGMLNNVHQHFIDAVKQGRGKRLKNPEANNIFTGLFWSGDQAIKIGVADKVGGIRDIGDIYKTDEFINYTPEDPVENLLKGLSMKMGQGIGSVVGSSFGKELKQTNDPVLK